MQVKIFYDVNLTVDTILNSELAQEGVKGSVTPCRGVKGGRSRPLLLFPLF